ncbi:RNP1, partial [Symbiodinium pilosum]
WCFVPAAELLLIVGEGIVGLSALGVFVLPQWQDAVPPRSVQEMIALAIPCFAQPFVAAPAAAALPQLGPGLPKGSSDREKIFVGGLPHHCTLDMLTAHFSRYGRITDAVVMADKATGKPRGFGFVVFEHISCVEAAIRDYGKHAIDGKWVDVKRATPQDQAAPPPQVFAPAPAAAADVRSASPPNLNASPEKPTLAPFNEVPPPRFDDAGPPAARNESYDPFG